MIESQLPYWVQYLQAVAPTLVAIAVGYVAYRQWATARDRVKLDLFEKRYAVYHELTTVLATTLQDGTIAYGDVLALSRSIRGYEFLFGKEVESYLKEITEKLNSLAYYEGQIALGGDNPNYDRSVDQSAELTNYVHDQLMFKSRPIFDKYLSLSHLK